MINTAISTAKAKTTPEKILDIIFQHRRLLNESDDPPRCRELLYLPCHLRKLEFFTTQAKPLHFILPAFPAKSPNLRKVLGKLPDMGERISLQFLHELCRQIQKIYAPGMQITICSDGRVFSDLVCVKEEDVTDYARQLRYIHQEINAYNLDFFNLEDEFNNLSFEEMRTQLIDGYADSLPNIRELIKSNSNHCSLFNGIHRFLCEDYQVLQPTQSRNRVRLECKTIAYEVIQRSDAWSNLIAKRFPHALRLSIHPQPYDSEKIGIHMIKAIDKWGTPWHNVAVHNGQEFILMKRHQAESMGASIVYHQGRPSHFVLPGITSQELL